jgi:MFS family permease
MTSSLRQRAAAYAHQARQLNRNCRLVFVSSALNGTAQGIFSVVFNLYILSLGVRPDVLGRILSAEPFAQALGSIPVGFMTEIVGFRNSFLSIYGVSSLAKLVQSSLAVLPIIALAGFIGGLAYSGDFVVRLPFLAANTDGPQRTYAYTFQNMLFGVSVSLGALFAGFAPNLLLRVTPNLTLAYRYTLYAAAGLSLLSLLPLSQLREPRTVSHRKISLYPYLNGMDRFTRQQALVSLFVGLSFGTLMSFANVYFVYGLKTSREFFGTISALTVVPITLATALGPAIANRLGTVKAVSWLRYAIPVSLLTLALTRNPWVATFAYWGQRALAMTSQPLSFAFAMEEASPKAKTAVSAWLNVTFWLGIGISAPVTGHFIARSDYASPLYLSAVAIFLAGLSNQIFFGSGRAGPQKEA